MPASVAVTIDDREPVGPGLAGARYDAYPTVAELVAADTDELTALEGIGETRARTILAALRDRPLE